MEKYMQHIPWPTPDWEEASPEARGMDSNRLMQLHTFIQDQSLPIYAMLIVRHGALVFEHYYQGYTTHSSFPIASCTKSILSSLIGIAFCKDSLHAFDQTLPDFLADEHLFKLDEQKRVITLRHLLTMVSGMDNLSSGRYHFEGYKSYMEAVFATPLLNPPGQAFCYGDPPVQVLAYLLESVMQTDLLTFATEQLFRPLKIATDVQHGFRWEKTPEGRYRGASGLHLRPRDMAKFGYLYLHRGYWEDQPLIPSSYAQASIQAHNTGGWPEDDAYGLLWWITTLGEHAAFFAAGLGGQFIFVVPAVDLVVVISSEYERRSSSPQKELFTRFVLPAIIS